MSRRAPPLAAVESAAKFLRDSGHRSSADEIFKERAAVVELLKCGREWLSAATPENRAELKRAFARLGVA